MGEPDWADISEVSKEEYEEELGRWLTQHSTSYEALDDVHEVRAFWRDFFRRGASAELSPAGHWLWNIAD